LRVSDKIGRALCTLPVCLRPALYRGGFEAKLLLFTASLSGEPAGRIDRRIQDIELLIQQRNIE
jgi:hypothetical protein